MSNAKLFSAPKNLGTEHERAVIRQKAFDEQYSELQKEWYLRLVSSGMDADTVFDNFGRRDEATKYSTEQEEQYSLYARWNHKADASSFQTGNDQNAAANARIWRQFSIGKTEREIADEAEISQQAVGKKLKALTARCHKDIRAGKLLSEKDSRAEINEFTRLQAIKEKHLKLVRSASFGETIVDSVTESGCLVRLELDNDLIDAFNRVTATLALALGAKV